MLNQSKSTHDKMKMSDKDVDDNKGDQLGHPLLKLLAAPKVTLVLALAVFTYLSVASRNHCKETVSIVKGLQITFQLHCSFFILHCS